MIIRKTLDIRPLYLHLTADIGRVIEDALRPFGERPVDLKPATPRLSLDIANACRDLGIPHRNTLVVSMGEFMRYAETVPEALRPYVRARFRDAVGRSPIVGRGELEQEIHDCAIAQSVRDLTPQLVSSVITLAAQVSQPHHEYLAEKYPDVFVTTSEAMPFGLLACLVEQLLLLTQGAFADAAKMGRMAQFYLDGHFPVGRIAKDDHVVLVA